MTSINNGGATDYWTLPENPKTLNDLIEYKDMSFAQGSIFKAAYRLGDDRHHSTKERDLNKIIYYAERMLDMIAYATSDPTPMSIDKKREAFKRLVDST